MTVKVRFGDFTTLTRSHSLDVPVDSARPVEAVAMALFDTVDLSRGVRLLGVSLSGFTASDGGTQLTLDLGGGDGSRAGGDRDDRMARVDEEAVRLQQSWGGVTGAVDAIRARFGRASVGTASLVGEDGLRIRDRGDAQWGPDGPPGDRR